ncbi:MAG: metal ABC transporter ATP-binding protein [Cyanobacteria bacterium J06554_11]
MASARAISKAAKTSHFALADTYGIAVDRISVAYSNARLALYNTSCYVEPGTITGLVGPNGGGKSTLFKSIMGFVMPSQGRVHLDGLPVAVAQKRQLMAYVPQADEVDWNFPISVFDVVMMGRYGHMNLFRIPSRKDRRIVAESLERVGMSEFQHRQIGELSGGQKKRAFLARALAQAGKVILLDEPFTGVDVKTEKSIITLLMQLREDGHTVLVSTHDLSSISTFCDRVILLNQTVLAAGTTAETFTEENLAMTFGGLPLSSLQGVTNNFVKNATKHPATSWVNQSPSAQRINQPGHAFIQPECVQPEKVDAQRMDV